MANNIKISVLDPLLGGAIGAIWGWRATFVVTAVLAVVAGAILVPMLYRLDLCDGSRGPRRPRIPGCSTAGSKLVALAVTNGGVMANMIHRHGERNTILPLYAASVLGLGGFSIATGIAAMALAGFIVMTPGGVLGDRIGRRRVISVGLGRHRRGRPRLSPHPRLRELPRHRGADRLGDFFSSPQTALLRRPPARTADRGPLRPPLLVRPRGIDRADLLAVVMDGAGVQAAVVLALVILLCGRRRHPARRSRPCRRHADFESGQRDGGTVQSLRPGVERIDRRRGHRLALALGNIYSPTGSEGPAGRVRPGVAGRERLRAPPVSGAHRGSIERRRLDPRQRRRLQPRPSTPHLDTTLRPDAVLSARDPLDRLYHSAWIEGDEIYGDGVVNDKGPMAAFLVAAKAIRESGYPLRGDRSSVP